MKSTAAQLLEEKRSLVKSMLEYPLDLKPYQYMAWLEDCQDEYKMAVSVDEGLVRGLTLKGAQVLRAALDVRQEIIDGKWVILDKPNGYAWIRTEVSAHAASPGTEA